MLECRRLVNYGVPHLEVHTALLVFKKCRCARKYHPGLSHVYNDALRISTSVFEAPIVSTLVITIILAISMVILLLCSPNLGANPHIECQVEHLASAQAI